ncbi:hypothetical protein GU243_11385 [Pseudarthrobacter psychrotolerans]|uniref:Uncharacterized protein n=1 Tax=Pseudarthrobacter psychrotolerans TaxID=2697569 RepID=A0A6P1NHZ5_9MICC|nr:hypothetical protein [Pseudarthrobacter psychrotolerans]QHK20235.1 hypothetical protein GU243_11385 [Pseudarthrobacter psychrotolerans]
MENTKPVLLVTSRAAWEKHYERYRRMGKRLNTIQGLLFIPFLASLLFLAGVLFPLVAGDIAFGHPGYYWYRAASDTALLVAAISLCSAPCTASCTGIWCAGLILLWG